MSELINVLNQLKELNQHPLAEIDLQHHLSALKADLDTLLHKHRATKSDVKYYVESLRNDLANKTEVTHQYKMMMEMMKEIKSDIDFNHKLQSLNQCDRDFNLDFDRLYLRIVDSIRKQTLTLGAMIIIAVPCILGISYLLSVCNGYH